MIFISMTATCCKSIEFANNLYVYTSPFNKYTKFYSFFGVAIKIKIVILDCVIGDVFEHL